MRLVVPKIRCPCGEVNDGSWWGPFDSDDQADKYVYCPRCSRQHRFPQPVKVIVSCDRIGEYQWHD